MGQKTTAKAFRDQLMSPRAIERVHALHALELELAGHPHSAVAEELEAFTARGIPFYAPDDAAYTKWVAKAVGYWEKLRGAAAHDHAPVPCMTAHIVHQAKRQPAKRAASSS